MRQIIRLFGIAAAITLLLMSFAACGRQQTATGQGPSSPGPTPAASSEGAKPKTTDPQALKGKILFAQLGCNACHMNPATGKDYPDLRGLYGSTVKLRDGSTVKVDDAYLRESLVDPNKRIVAGYQPSMPSYSYVKEEDLQALIAYIRSLKDEKPEFVKAEASAEGSAGASK